VGMRRIVVRIDSLVLKGIRYEDRHAISAAVQQELARALAAPGTAHELAAMGSAPALRAGTVDVAPSASVRDVGSAAARRMAQTLRGVRR
jgi:hypothetical protein